MIKTLLRLSIVMIWANTVIMKLIIDGRTGSAVGLLSWSMSRIIEKAMVIRLKLDTISSTGKEVTYGDH